MCFGEIHPIDHPTKIKMNMSTYFRIVKKKWKVTVVDIDTKALKRMEKKIFPSRYGYWYLAHLFGLFVPLDPMFNPFRTRTQPAMQAFSSVCDLSLLTTFDRMATNTI